MSTVGKPSRVRIQQQDFDLTAEVAALRDQVAGVGAVVSFLGTVREHSQGGALQGMRLEHYPGMTEACIETMIDHAMARFQILAARVIHRVGWLLPHEQIVWVGVAAAHRGEAFAACEYLMDSLKTQAPFWKQESVGEQSRWVLAQARDDEASARWQSTRAGVTP